MCEAKAYLLKGSEEEEIMEEVNEIVEENGTVTLRSIFGEEKVLKAKLKSFSLVSHRVILEPIP